MSYDPQKDVVPVTGLAASPFILAATPSFQGQSLRDVIALANLRLKSRGASDKEKSNNALAASVTRC
jgi:tripartite-type tricarboxylate transporter receptor subunit TctC